MKAVSLLFVAASWRSKQALTYFGSMAGIIKKLKKDTTLEGNEKK